ncbi:MAG: ABC transporter permease [Lachnospiraceae bacterium]
MFRFIIKRLFYMIPVVLGISFVVYAIISFTPGDPAQLILGADTDPAILAAKRVELGLNDPFLLRYLKYISGVFVGNLGNSYRTGLPVLSELLIRLPNTLIIALGGIGLSVIIGVPLGLVSAVKQYTFVDYFARTLALLLTAIPAFWLGLMLLLYFVLNLNLLPATGANSWKNFVLPIVTLAASAAATQTRTTRSSMLEVIRQDYIRTALAKGVPEGRIIWKHVIRNGILPVITIIGMNIGVQLGGTVVIENVFAIPGMGSILVNSVRIKDTPMIVSSIILVAVFIGICNLLVDIVYAYIDPRIKAQYFSVASKRGKAKTKTGGAVA